MPFGDEEDVGEEFVPRDDPRGNDSPVEANVDTESPGPVVVDEVPPVSEPQPVISEALPEGEVERAEDEEATKPLPEFDPRWREAFEGLMFIGYLTKEFNYLGHKFVIKTLNIDETLEVGLLSQPYQGSMGDLRAYQAAVCAGCVVTVDDIPLPLPITTTPEDTILVNRFIFVRKNWFSPVIDAVYEKYLELEALVAQVVAAMGEAVG